MPRTMPSKAELKELKEKIRSVVLNSDIAMDVGNIAREVDCTNYIAQKLIDEIIFEYMVEIDPETYDKLPIKWQKTTKSAVYVPQRQLEAEIKT